jgi:hypothetical protein
MLDIYCHSCGGFISDPRHIEYRLPPSVAELGTPRSSFCACRPPILYRSAPRVLAANAPPPEYRGSL